MKSKRVNWKSVDWSESDWAISKKLGCSKTEVNFKRVKHHQSVNPEADRETIKSWLNRTGTSQAELAHQLDISVQTVERWLTKGKTATKPSWLIRKQLVKMKILPSLKTAYDWKNVDWSKPTSQIAREAGASLNAVVSKRNKYSPETVQKISRKK